VSEGARGCVGSEGVSFLCFESSRVESLPLHPAALGAASSEYGVGYPQLGIRMQWVHLSVCCAALACHVSCMHVSARDCEYHT
jgi:hypothetical protein